MSSRVPLALRRKVFARAQGLCEYCLVHESDTFLGLQIEHIISEKHGGRNEHFHLDGIRLLGISEVGDATAALLSFNIADRLQSCKSALVPN